MARDDRAGVSGCAALARRFSRGSRASGRDVPGFSGGLGMPFSGEGAGWNRDRAGIFRAVHAKGTDERADRVLKEGLTGVLEGAGA